MTIRITYDSKTIDLKVGSAGLQTDFKQFKKENRSASGKIETINLYGIQELSFEAHFLEQIYYDLLAWWSWARQGKPWAFALNSSMVGDSKLDGAANAGQKVIPVHITDGFTVGDFCLLRTAADDVFEIIEIDSIITDVSITAVDDLKFSYGAVGVGNNIILNGVFDTDTANWTAGNAATLASIAGGKAGNCLRITGDGQSNPYAYQDVAVISGEFYYFEGYVKAGTEATYRTFIRNNNDLSYIWLPNSLEETAGDWSTLFNKAFKAPVGCDEVRIALEQIAAASAGTTMLYDSALLNEGIDADSLRHIEYWPAVISLEQNFNPKKLGDYYTHVFKFIEAL